MNELERTFDEMLSAVATGKHRWPEMPLTAFFPVKGRGAIGELMIVGRAVNGCENGWLPREAADAERRRGIVAESRAMAAGSGDCPLRWIPTSVARLVERGGKIAAEFAAMGA